MPDGPIVNVSQAFAKLEELRALVQTMMKGFADLTEILVKEQKEKERVGALSEALTGVKRQVEGLSEK